MSQYWKSKFTDRLKGSTDYQQPMTLLVINNNWLLMATWPLLPWGTIIIKTIKVPNTVTIFSTISTALQKTAATGFLEMLVSLSVSDS